MLEFGAVNDVEVRGLDISGFYAGVRLLCYTMFLELRVYPMVLVQVTGFGCRDVPRPRCCRDQI